jgi:hypothetical protein
MKICSITNLIVLILYKICLYFCIYIQSKFKEKGVHFKDTFPKIYLHKNESLFHDTPTYILRDLISTKSNLNYDNAI